MNRQEAAEVLTELKQRLEISDDDDYCYYSRDIDAYDTALTALSGWVLLTRETAPTEPDETPFLVYMEGWFERPYDAVRVWTAGEIRYIPEEVIAYMPLPPLPETVGVEGTKINGRGDAM